MLAVLVFSVLLLVAILLSELADRTLFSIPVMFLIGGYLIGPDMLGIVQVSPDTEGIRQFVELTLFAVLLVDGMHGGINELKEVWQLPGRALLIGFPLSIVLMAGLARLLLQLSWVESFLVGAILSPTDPVFASALVKRHELPADLRRLLNVESGFNDGLALPIVLTVLALAGPRSLQPVEWLLEVLMGIGLGIGVPWLVLRLQGIEALRATDLYKPLVVLTIGLILYALSALVGANKFIAAFTAGITVASLNPELCKAFYPMGNSLSEVLKLAAVLIFGALLSRELFEQTHWQAIVFAIAILLFARPAAMALALLDSRLEGKEKVLAAWFRPAGFASIVYGLLLFGSRLERAEELFRIVAVAVVAFILAHSTTDVLASRWLMDEQEGREVQQGS